MSAIAKKEDNFEQDNRIAQSGGKPVVTNHTVDVTTLPPEVRESMIDYDNMMLEQLVLKVLPPSGALCRLDKIVLDLWLKFQAKHDRMKVIARLRSLCKQGLVDQKKHIRSTYALTEAGMSLLADFETQKQQEATPGE